MPLTGHLRELRKKVGHDLLVLPSAAVALHDEQGRVLLGLHSDRQIWVLPGGLIEPCETPGDGAVRETWEETGLIVELTGILGVYGGKELLVDYVNGDRRPTSAQSSEALPLAGNFAQIWKRFWNCVTSLARN